MPRSDQPAVRSALDQPTDEREFRDWLERMARHRGLRGPDGLAHAKLLFAALDNPQNRVPVVHIVGTAGKGTIAYLLTSRLVARGQSVATHMSPHVYDPRERFLLNGEFPDWVDVLAAARQVSTAAEKVTADTSRPPSYFAITAAMSWELGRIASTDYSVVEAGIGGRYDATNAIDRSDRILVVTAVGIDHIDVLGTTVEEIAKEKVAAARGCACVVLAPQPNPVVRDIVAEATALLDVQLVEAAGPAGGDWRLQADLIAATTETLLLGSRGADPKVQLLPPGRLERLEIQERTYVFDGAHNELKLAWLASALHSDPSGEPSCVVAVVGRGKSLAGCAAEIAQIAPIVIATEFDTDPNHPGEGPHSWAAVDLAAALTEANPAVQVVVARSPQQAVAAARRATRKGDVIAVTGSFLHLSAMKEAVID